MTNREVGRILYYAGRYDEAIADLNRTAELDPKSQIVFSWIALAYLEKGMGDQFMAMMRRQRLNFGFPADRIAEEQRAFAGGGMKGYWTLMRSRILEHRRPGFGQEYSLAGFNARLGDKDEAFRWLEEAYQQRSFGLTMIKVDPQFATLRADARFASLLQRMGFR